MGEIEKRFVKPLRGELDSIAKAQQAAEATTLETRLYVSTVHADVSQAQGDAKHQLSRAIQLSVGIAKAHNFFEHATAKIRLEKSELQQVQDFAKKMKQYGATEEIRRLIDSGLEELKHQTWLGMSRIGCPAISHFSGHAGLVRGTRPGHAGLVLKTVSRRR